MNKPLYPKKEKKNPSKKGRPPQKRVLKAFLSLFLLFALSLSTIPSFLISVKAEGEGNMSQDEMVNKIKQFDDKDSLDRLNDIYENEKIERPEGVGDTKQLIKYIFYRVMRQDYIWDVDKGIAHKFTGKQRPGVELQDKKAIWDENGKSLAEGGGGEHLYVCNHDKDGHLLYHGCNLRNLIPEVVSSIRGIIVDKNPVKGGQVTPSFALWGLGVPPGLPEVPASKEDIGWETRYDNFTLMELFGYNLPVTSYRGEWDHIKIYTLSRMLTDIGFFDGVKLFATSLWNGLKGGLAAIISGFDLNPIKWIGNIFMGSAGGSLIVVLDTSDENIALQHAWSRESFAPTVYNARYLTPRQVIRKFAYEFVEYIKDHIEEKLEKNDDIKDWISTDYDSLPFWEVDCKPSDDPACIRYIYHKRQIDTKQISATGSTISEAESKVQNLKEESFIDESLIYYPKNTSKKEMIKARESFKNATKDAAGSNITQTIIKETSTTWKVTITFPVYESSKKQFKRWAENSAVTKGFDNLAQTRNIACFDRAIDPDDERTLEEFEACYKDRWIDGLRATIKEGSPELNNVINSLQEDFYKENHHGQPQRDFSRWVCVDEPEDGSILTEREILEAPYMFEEEDDEKPNPECKAIRPYIEGSLSGNGYLEFEDNYHIKDTRWLQFSRSREEHIRPRVGGFFTSLTQKVVIITNTVLGLSFTDLVRAFGIDKLFLSVFNKMRDSLFYPLIAMFMTFMGIWLFVRYAMTKSALGFIIGLSLSFSVFLGSIFLLEKPHALLYFVNDFPNKVDNFIAEMIKLPPTVNKVCKAEGPSKMIREQECLVWHIGIFTPYLQKQWGTALQNLDHDKIKDLKVADLIGDPGPSKNWAIRQLELIKSGSINKDNPDRQKGITDRNFYRMVDLQAGPNLAEGRLTSYFPVWSGTVDSGALIPLMAFIVSIFMALLIIPLSLFKIEMTFSSIFRLFLIPFVALFGLLPDGYYRFKSYLMTTANLIIKRIMATFLITVVLYMLALIFAA